MVIKTKTVEVISDEDLSEIMDLGVVLSTKDVGHAVVHEVLHNQTPTIVVASSIGSSFKIL